MRVCTVYVYALREMHERKSTSHNKIAISSDKNYRNQMQTSMKLVWTLIAEFYFAYALKPILPLLNTIEELMCIYLWIIQRTNYFIE